MKKANGAILAVLATSALMAGNIADAQALSGTGHARVTDNLTGTLEIQYFVGGYGDEWWHEVINAFQQAHPKLHIIQDEGPKINDQMKPRWISNNPPDVVYLDGPNSTDIKAQMVKDHQLVNLTSWLKSAKAPDGKLLSSHFIEQPQIYDDGKEYTVPLVFGYYGTWYDAHLFKQKGWEPPTNWDTFTSDMQKAKSAGMYGYIHQGIYPYYIENGLLFSGFTHFGGLQTLEDFNSMKKGVYLSKPVQETMQQIQKLSSTGLIDKGALALNHTASQMEWLQHKASFIPCGLWLPNEMKSDVPAGFDFGFVPSIWQKAGQKYEAISYEQDIAVASHAKNPTAAKAFIQFVYQDKYAVDWIKKTGALMDYKIDLSKQSGIPQYAKQAENYLLDASKVNIDQPKHLLNPDMQKVLDDATTALLAGQIDAKQWGQRMESSAASIRSGQ